MSAFSFNLCAGSTFSCFKRQPVDESPSDTTAIGPNKSTSKNKTTIQKMDSNILNGIEDLLNMTTSRELKLGIILMKLMQTEYDTGIIFKNVIDKNSITDEINYIIRIEHSSGFNLNKMLRYNLTNYPLIYKNVVVGSILLGRQYAENSNDEIILEDALEYLGKCVAML